MNTMTMEMTAMNETELGQVGGGSMPLWSLLVGSYKDLLDKIERNPEQYTWMMDWYYS